MKILITGASSLVAAHVVPELQAQGHDIVLTSRTRPAWFDGRTGLEWAHADLLGGGLSSMFPVSVNALIHLAPLSLLRSCVELLCRPGLRRLIAFGTTSRFTKAESKVPVEQRMVRQQTAAEQWLALYAAESGIDWTLFRPTMVYDGIGDKNVALIARFIHRFGFFPLVGDASGMRQPVHAIDLAQACCEVLDNQASFGKAYNLAGGEILTYKSMVDCVFAARGRKPRYVRIPPPLLRAVLGLARHMPRYHYLNSAMADRMNKDMTFDCADAVNDFGYCPRKFTLC